MDLAYDHIQEEALSPDSEGEIRGPAQPTNLNAEFQEAFKAVSSSPWGSKLGGWFGQVRKQGESFYQDLQKEASEASEQATKGFTSLREQVVNRTRSLSFNAEPAPAPQIPGEEGVPSIVTPSSSQTDIESLDTTSGTESLSTDIVKEAGSLVASLRQTAAAKLKDLQQAEDAADEALLRFGSNVRNFLRDAVTISAPGEGDSNKPRGRDAVGNEVLFETQEPSTGKKVFHSTRLDAQLHAIHTNIASFSEDPQGQEWDEWEKSFDIDKQTDLIAADLDKYEQLRRTMEKLVPEKVEYASFWRRYYFLRKAVEEEERRRKEVLKGAATETEEEVAWDDDDDDESSTPSAAVNKASESTTTLHATATNDLLKPKSPRRSEDENKSVADSDASYDMVSGATSRAPSSPKDEKKDGGKEESDDDDWE